MLLLKIVEAYSTSTVVGRASMNLAFPLSSTLELTRMQFVIRFSSKIAINVIIDASTKIPSTIKYKITRDERNEELLLWLFYIVLY
jgi:hypothetical protein